MARKHRMRVAATLFAASLEPLESRRLLSLNVPDTAAVTITWGVAGGNWDQANFTWHDSDPSGTTYDAQWTDTKDTWISDSAHTFSTYAQSSNNFTASQTLDAGQKYWYRVRAHQGSSYSAWSTPISPRAPRDEAVELEATADSGGMHLSWTNPETLPSGTAYVKYNVYRKARGDAAFPSTPLNSSELSTLTYTDSVSSGSAYEYQVQRKYYTSGNTLQRSGWGYIYAARNKAAVASRGTALLVIDSSLTSTSIHSSGEVAQFNADLQQYKLDLIGDGWKVKELQTTRDLSDPTNASQATALKFNASNSSDTSTINGVYNTTSGGLQSIVLIGHVPVPYSGQFVAPDGHGDHYGAWPTDLYYGSGLGQSSPDSGWTKTLNYTNTTRPQQNNGSSDGKFDNASLPGDLVVPVGRIDFANMSEMKYTFPPIATNTWPSPESAEMLMMQRYFDKDHRWRTGELDVQKRALIDDQFGMGATGFIRPEDYFANMSTLVGRDNIHARDWESNPHDNSYLWACGGGSGADSGAAGVTSLHLYYHDPVTGATVAEVPYQAAFVQLAGSYFGDFDHNQGGSGYYANLMRATLGMEGASLAVTYGVKTDWLFQTMGLGETMGDALTLTVNNTNDVYLDETSEEAAIWQNLLGDPTLTMTIVEPVDTTSVAVAASIDVATGAATITWPASPDETDGYKIFRASAIDGTFTEVGSRTHGQSRTFTDSSPGGAYVYMVRAVQLVATPSGSYYELSKGTFASEVTLVGTSTDDDFYLKRQNGSGENTFRVWANASLSGAPTYKLDALTVTSISIDALGGNDDVTADFAAGTPVPSAGLTVSGGSGSADSIAIWGTSGADEASFEYNGYSEQIDMNDSNIASLGSATEAYAFDGQGGGDDVTLMSGPTVTFPDTQHFASLDVQDEATGRVAEGANATLVLTALSLDTDAVLDLTDNDMIVRSGSMTKSAIESSIRNARDGGAWDEKGITSSTTASLKVRATGLGVLSGSQYTGFGHSTFNAETYASGDTLVKYTWNGDTDFSGTVNFDDYARTDTGYSSGGTDWAHGDFDFSGDVDFDDYALIDVANNAQTGVL